MNSLKTSKNGPLLKRHLNYFDSTMIVCGSVIGVGIFINPAESAKFLSSPSQLLFVWALAGFISFIGAICFAELGAMFPYAGGQYVYLKKAFSPWMGFLFGWTLFSTIQTGVIAAVSFTCARFISYFFSMNDFTVSLVAAAIIWFLSLVNFFGIKQGSLVQNVFTSLKLFALLIIIGVGFFWFKAPDIILGPIFPQGITLQSIKIMGLALVPALFSYGGWQDFSYVLGEIKNPARNIPVSFLSGISIVIIVYVLVNSVFIKTLSLAEISNSTKIASDSVKVMMGSRGTAFFSLAIIVSTLSIANVAILAGSRVYYSMAKEKAFFPIAAKLHPSHSTPYASIFLQSLWATILLFTNTYSQLLQYVIFGTWLFLGLSVISLFIFRKKMPDASRPFKTWGYPFTPFLFSLISAAVVLNIIVSNFVKSLIGIGIILAGFPIYYLLGKQRIGDDKKV